VFAVAYVHCFPRVAEKSFNTGEDGAARQAHEAPQQLVECGAPTAEEGVMH
jgi:hypothetical protein